MHFNRFVFSEFINLKYIFSYRHFSWKFDFSLLGDKFFRQFGAQGGEPTESKRIQKVLIVTKLSRYEYEQQRHPNLSKEQLERHIRDRGSDFEIMMHYHNLHKKFEKKIAKSFQNAGVEVRVANR